MSEKQSLQFYLGAEDIDRIVKALLPVLESYLPVQTKDQQYVFLTTLVNRFSKEKTFSNKTELDSLVKNIANKVASRTMIIQPDSEPPCNATKVPFGDTCGDFADNNETRLNSCDNYYQDAPFGPENCYRNGNYCVGAVICTTQ